MNPGVHLGGQEVWSTLGLRQLKAGIAGSNLAQEWEFFLKVPEIFTDIRNKQMFQLLAMKLKTAENNGYSACTV
jgi:hypothetical protein